MKYNYLIEIRNCESGEVIGRREFSNLELVKQTMEDVPKWIKNWEDNYTAVCSICGERKILDEITFKDTDENKDEPICQSCAELLIDGSKKLPQIEVDELNEKGGDI